MDAFYNLETEGLSDISAPPIATGGAADQAWQIAIASDPHFEKIEL
jgi:hypothetical protein